MVGARWEPLDNYDVRISRSVGESLSYAGGLVDLSHLGCTTEEGRPARGFFCILLRPMAFDRHP